MMSCDFNIHFSVRQSFVARQLECCLAAVNSRLDHQLAQHPSVEVRWVVSGLRSSNRVSLEKLQRDANGTYEIRFRRATGNKSVLLKAFVGDPRSPAGR